MRFLLLGLIAMLSCQAVQGQELALPAGIVTHADGRAPVGELFGSWLGLRDQGWRLEVIAQSQPPGTDAPLPIIALLSPKAGPATWMLAGIHGEEPAGPNAIAAALERIAALGREHPVVLLPLLNPQGYARNWRYLNVATYREDVPGQSVGDSSHLLPSTETPDRAREAAASSAEADAITRFVLRTVRDYPPRVSIDLHEDNLIDAGYVYSQGINGAKEPLALTAVAVLREGGIPIQQHGETRFGEPIVEGIIGPVIDSSIDELLSSPVVIIDGQRQPGPWAEVVLVLETPAAALPLAQRVAAHAALLRRIAESLASR